MVSANTKSQFLVSQVEPFPSNMYAIAPPHSSFIALCFRSASSYLSTSTINCRLHHPIDHALIGFKIPCVIVYSFIWLWLIWFYSGEHLIQLYKSYLNPNMILLNLFYKSPNLLFVMSIEFANSKLSSFTNHSSTLSIMQRSVSLWCWFSLVSSYVQGKFILKVCLQHLLGVGFR